MYVKYSLFVCVTQCKQKVSCGTSQVELQIKSLIRKVISQKKKRGSSSNKVLLQYRKLYKMRNSEARRRKIPSVIFVREANEFLVHCWRCLFSFSSLPHFSIAFLQYYYQLFEFGVCAHSHTEIVQANNKNRIERFF